MFSARLPDRLDPNRLSLATARARASGEPVFDLTETNPTVVGLEYPRDLLLALSDPDARIYRPEPAGIPAARRAIAAEYPAEAGLEPSAFVLTASTSEAYGLLFKLLADPGDEVLVPKPSYPLFDLLTSLDGVAAVPYRLDRAA